MIKTPDLNAHWARLKTVMERRGQRASIQRPVDTSEVPASLVSSAKAASWIAYFCLVYFLWLYTLDIARDRAAPLYLTHIGLWVAAKDGLRLWFPYIIGFGVISIGIPYVAKIAIPTFMSLTWRGNAWPKAWALFIAISVSLVVFAGTFTIQGDAILEKGRESSVAVAQVEQGAAVLQAKIASKEAELKTMMDNQNAYLAQAASVGAAEWQRSYIDKTPANDPQRDRIVRALGAARAADAVRANLDALRVQAASQTTIAAVAEHPAATAGTSWISSAIDYIQGIRAILLSLVMDIVALLMPWIALRLEQARNRGVTASYDNTIAIEDHSADAPLEVQPYKQPIEQRQIYFDEDGNRIVKKREHWAKVPTQKAKRKVPGKNGKMVADETEYEKPAASITLNADLPEMETVKVEEPDGDFDGHNSASGDRAALDKSNVRTTELSDAGTVTPDHAADGRIRRAEGDSSRLQASDLGTNDRPPTSGAPEGADTLALSAAHGIEPATGEEPEEVFELGDGIERDAPANPQPHTVILDDARFDEMVAKGQITEDGAPLPQDGAEVIEQPRDAEAEEFADKFGLPKPRSNGALEHMQ